MFREVVNKGHSSGQVCYRCAVVTQWLKISTSSIVTLTAPVDTGTDMNYQTGTYDVDVSVHLNM